MKRKLSALSGQYVAALRHHLKQGPRASLEPARTLGRQAVAARLETLDVARIHHQAIARLEGSASKDGLLERAEIFFTETITPIEETHRVARQSGARLSRLNQTLNRRTAALAASHRSLQQGITQRKTVEVALKKSGKHYQKLLKESLALQKHLQLLTHRLLRAQEGNRKRLSHDLQDEISQTLLGINVRLLTVKATAGRNAEGLSQELADTQRLVDRSVKTIRRFARKCGKHHEP
jgi:signal transduction histidine kinase